MSKVRNTVQDPGPHPAPSTCKEVYGKAKELAGFGWNLTMARDLLEVPLCNG